MCVRYTVTDTEQQPPPEYIYCSDVSSKCIDPYDIQVIGKSSFYNVPLGVYYLCSGTLFIAWNIPCLIAMYVEVGIARCYWDGEREVLERQLCACLDAQVWL